DEFVEQSGRNGAGKACDYADSRSVESGLDGGERGGIPNGPRLNRVPRIVDVAEGDAIVLVDIMVDTDEFFAPTRRQSYVRVVSRRTRLVDSTDGNQRQQGRRHRVNRLNLVVGQAH